MESVLMLKMRQGGKTRWAFLLFIVCVPLTALADAGTPLMWAGMLHLVFGNALIGAGEGLLLAFFFRLSKWKCALIMIAANYFSAWIGAVFLFSYAIKAVDLDLYSAWHWVWSMVPVTFVMTCVLEWPFVFFCLRKSEGRIKKSLWGNLAVQFISYLLVFGWYSSASQKSLYTEMHIVRPGSFLVPTNGVIYFISTKGDLNRKNVSGGDETTIVNLNSTNKGDQLFLVQNKTGETGLYYLRLHLGMGTNIPLCVISNLNVVATVPQKDQGKESKDGVDIWATFGDVARIGSASNSMWEFYAGFWPNEGLQGENHKTGENLHLAFETPFVQWMIRDAYHLPGDCVVFQLGDNQICILDPNTKRVALLAKGHGPVVVLQRN